MSPVIRFKVVPRPAPRPSSLQGICWVAKQIHIHVTNKIHDLQLEDAWEYARRNGLLKKPETEVQKMLKRPRSRSELFELPHWPHCPCVDCRQETSSLTEEHLPVSGFHLNILYKEKASLQCIIYDPNLDKVGYFDLHFLTNFQMACKLFGPRDGVIWNSALHDEWSSESSKLSGGTKRALQKQISMWRKKYPEMTVEQFTFRFERQMKTHSEEAMMPISYELGFAYPSLESIMRREVYIDFEELNRLVEPFDTFKYHKMPLNYTCTQFWYLWINGYKNQTSIRQFEVERCKIQGRLGRPYQVLCADRAKIASVIFSCIQYHQIPAQVACDFMDLVANINVTHPGSENRTKWIAANADELHELMTEKPLGEILYSQILSLQSPCW